MYPPEAAVGVREGGVHGERRLVFGDGFVVSPVGQKDPALLVASPSVIWIEGERLGPYRTRSSLGEGVQTAVRRAENHRRGCPHGRHPGATPRSRQGHALKSPETVRL